MAVAEETKDRVVRFMQEKGAPGIQHVGGTLMPHLVGTCTLLEEWGNPEPLCLAGLVHTAYGTDGFNERFFDPLTQRSELAELVGPEAEAIIYFYDSCDRKMLYPRVRKGEPIRFRDRYTGQETDTPDPALYRLFLELTFANELEIFRRVQMPAEQIEKWRLFFSNTESQVSAGAVACFRSTLAAPKSKWKFW